MRDRYVPAHDSYHLSIHAQEKIETPRPNLYKTIQSRPLCGTRGPELASLKLPNPDGGGQRSE